MGDSKHSVVMRRLARFAATGFGVGRIPVAPGTFGTLLAIPVYLMTLAWGSGMYVLLVAVMFVAGVWFCRVAVADLADPDPSAVVWDEIVGYLVTMFLAPPGWVWLVVGFVLFRLFDIWKPFPIRYLERRLGGGWGVMVDDVLAGIYAWSALQLLVWVVAAR
jgi:phosphatidylglycerophosphatase A